MSLAGGLVPGWHHLTHEAPSLPHICSAHSPLPPQPQKSAEILWFLPENIASLYLVRSYHKTNVISMPFTEILFSGGQSLSEEAEEGRG